MRTRISALLAVALSVTLAAPAAAATPSYGAGYLGRQLDAAGGHFGTDISDTAYAVLGLHAAGYGRNQAAAATNFLSTQLGAPLHAADGTDNPGLVAYDILAAVADGRDPRHFGGTAEENNLVTRLINTQQPTGLFGTAAPTFDGAFRQGLALTALKAANVTATNAAVVKGTAWLRDQQCANGLWTSFRADTTVACAAADPDAFAGPDTNSTGMAAQGLAAYYQYPRRSALISALDTARSADGGFAFIAAPGQPSDPNSTALAIQALLAYNGSLGAAKTALASYQLGCAAPAADRGAYFYPGSTAANLLATVQAVPAAAGKTFPLPPSTISTSLPAISCAATTKVALTGTAGPCAGTSGVTVTVDFTSFGGAEQTRCATGAQSSGLTALQNAGFTPTGTDQWGLAFICRVNNFPSPAQEACVNTPPANAYWAYYHALSGATTWSYSTKGASSYQPPLGSIDAWAFGGSAQPTLTPAQVRAGQ